MMTSGWGGGVHELQIILFYFTRTLFIRITGELALTPHRPTSFSVNDPSTRTMLQPVPVFTNVNSCVPLEPWTLCPLKNLE